MTVFPTKSINDVTDTLIDYRGKTPPKTDSGVRLVTAKVIKGGFVTNDKRNGPRILDSRLSVFCPHIMRPDHAATGHITRPS